VGFRSGDRVGVELLPTAIYTRRGLPVDEEVAGPAIVTQVDSTTLVPPGCSVRRDAIDNLLITVPKSTGS
jgi:N-methylhydantoinase A